MPDTPLEARIRALWPSETKTLQDIAAELEMSPSTLSQRASRMGLPKKKTKFINWKIAPGARHGQAGKRLLPTPEGNKFLTVETYEEDPRLDAVILKFWNDPSISTVKLGGELGMPPAVFARHLRRLKLVRKDRVEAAQS